jgi:hypothetical protein
MTGCDVGKGRGSGIESVWLWELVLENQYKGDRMCCTQRRRMVSTSGVTTYCKMV